MPNLFHHVIVRGIERRDIFMDDADRHSFVQRLSSLLEKTETSCYAWALLSNHFHLLLRPTHGKLSTFMRRLLTGHAVAFNLRHQRTGHLFQNRYKSIICQEDEYLLQLVRYIHLNPIRARMVADLNELAHYPWSGHSILLGKQELAGQRVDPVLALFDGKQSKARFRYLDFMADGIAEGRRDDLVGRQKCYVEGEYVDPRILGDQEFVEEIRLHNGNDGFGARRPISEIVAAVADEHGIPLRAITGKTRMKAAVRARSAVCRSAMEEGHSAAEIGRHLGMSSYGVGRAGRRDNDDRVKTAS
jgi:REP-associated tyrosine transposase